MIGAQHNLLTPSEGGERDAHQQNSKQQHPVPSPGCLWVIRKCRWDAPGELLAPWLLLSIFLFLSVFLVHMCIKKSFFRFSRVIIAIAIFPNSPIPVGPACPTSLLGARR